MTASNIVRYDDEFIRKFEDLERFVDVTPEDYPVMHRYLIDSFGYLYRVFQHYSLRIATGEANDFDDVDEETRRELMRPLSYRQYQMIERSFSRWEEERHLVISSLWDYLHDNGRIYDKKVMSSAEVCGFSLVLMNVYRVIG